MCVFIHTLKHNVQFYNTKSKNNKNVHKEKYQLQKNKNQTAVTIDAK